MNRLAFFDTNIFIYAGDAPVQSKGIQSNSSLSGLRFYVISALVIG